MHRIRLLILSFLCLLTFATRAQANLVTHSNYKFTGKERDVETDSKPNECLHLQFGAAKVGYMSKANVETGYDYFGARFYGSPLGIWLSVDPLVDKTIQMSSYMYCNGNPIILRDPDGRLPQAVVGALVSAAADYAIQVGMNMIAGDNFSTALTHNIDVKSIAVSAASGAIGVGAIKNIKRAAQLYGLGKSSTQVLIKSSTVIIDIGASATEQELNNGEVDMNQLTIDVAAGRLGDAVGGAVTKRIKNTNTVKCLENKIDRRAVNIITRTEIFAIEGSRIQQKRIRTSC